MGEESQAWWSLALCLNQPTQEAGAWGGSYLLGAGRGGGESDSSALLRPSPEVGVRSRATLLLGPHCEASRVHLAPVHSSRTCPSSQSFQYPHHLAGGLTGTGG